MISRRPLLAATGLLLAGRAAWAQSGLWPEWIGIYDGAARFYRSIPLEDIYPPPKDPHVDLDDRNPFGVHFDIRETDGSATVWLRIDGGPMQTADSGEAND